MNVPRALVSLPLVLVGAIAAPQTVAGSSDYASAVLADNPIGYWRLGELTGFSAVDQSGAHDGSYGALVALGATGALQQDSDSAASFTGSASSKISIDTAAALTPNEFTIELWARLTGAPGAGRSPAAYRDLVSESNISGWQIAVNSGGSWEFRTGRGNVGTGSAWTTIVGPAAVQDEWTYVAGTYDGADMRFYIDGVPVGEQVGVPYLPVDSFFFFIHFFIGASRTEDVSGNGDLFWIGDIDEVAYYGHALDAAAIQQRHALGTGSGGPRLETILGVDRVGAEAVFEWNTEVGSDYRLRRSADRSSWTDVASPIPGTGGIVGQADSLGSGSSLEFYRVEID